MNQNLIVILLLLFYFFTTERKPKTQVTGLVMSQSRYLNHQGSLETDEQSPGSSTSTTDVLQQSHGNTSGIDFDEDNTSSLSKPALATDIGEKSPLYFTFKYDASAAAIC